MAEDDKKSLFKVDAPFVRELADFGIDAFGDPEEITEMTAKVAKTIIADQKNNRDNDSRSMLALLWYLREMRTEQKKARQIRNVIVFAFGVVITTVVFLFELGLLKHPHM